MHDLIAVQMMQRCLTVIESQREQIARLTPKAEAYDRLGALIDVHLRGNQNRLGVEVDVTWSLRSEIERATERMSAEKSKTDPRADRPADYRDPDEQPKMDEEHTIHRASQAATQQRHTTTQTLRDD